MGENLVIDSFDVYYDQKCNITYVFLKGPEFIKERENSCDATMIKNDKRS